MPRCEFPQMLQGGLASEPIAARRVAGPWIFSLVVKTPPSTASCFTVSQPLGPLAGSRAALPRETCPRRAPCPYAGDRRRTGTGTRRRRASASRRRRTTRRARYRVPKYVESWAPAFHAGRATGRRSGPVWEIDDERAARILTGWPPELRNPQRALAARPEVLCLLGDAQEPLLLVEVAAGGVSRGVGLVRRTAVGVDRVCGEDVQGRNQLLWALGLGLWLLALQAEQLAQEVERPRPVGGGRADRHTGPDRGRSRGCPGSRPSRRC